MQISDFGLSGFPFATVPTPERSHIWAGRTELKKKLITKVRNWGIKTGSEIDLFWADWGQGKSHSLFYLANLLPNDDSNIVHYVQLPSLAGIGQPFKAVYDQLMADFPLDVLADRVYRHFEPGNNMNQIFSAQTRSAWPAYVLQLLWMIKVQNPSSYIAEAYLRGNRVTQRDLNQLVMGGRQVHLPPAPRSAQDCQKLLSDVIKVATTFPRHGGQFVLLVDEFQRIGSLGAAKMKQVCDSLHLIFNSNPTGLRIILTFAISDPQSISVSLTGDLRSRVTDFMSLPPMDRAEVKLYLKGLLEAYQNDDSRSWAPFDETGLDLLSDFAYEAADGEDDLCTPRKVNMVGEEILLNLINMRDEGASMSGELGLFSSAEVKRVIEECHRGIRARISGDFDDGGV